MELGKYSPYNHKQQTANECIKDHICKRYRVTEKVYILLQNCRT